MADSVAVQMAQGAPTFGNVLKSIGEGVVVSQQKLDQSIVDTVTTLNGTKIKVATDVVVALGDDGLPLPPTDASVKYQEVSVLNYTMPTVHEWKHVAISMDLTLSHVSTETGLNFNQTQWSGGTEGYGLFFGYVGWFSASWHEQEIEQKYNYKNEADWARGQVRLDAQLGPRRTTKLPVAASVSVGPTIIILPGPVVDVTTGSVLTGRSMDLKVKLLKKDGGANPGKTPVVNAGGFRVEYVQATTDSLGEAKYTIKRDISSPAFAQPRRSTISVTLGDIVKTLDITL